ncbi:acrB/AcrD/AcrF family protein, partial [Vibrio parahaemolyticus V-223/04]
GLWCVTHSF